jgi:MOSC domain-containing protein YiiM
VVALHLSTASRAPLVVATRVEALEERGLEGDRHGKPNSRRSVLLMDVETLDSFGLEPGDVREQVTVRGLDLTALVFGSRLRVGSAVLEVAGPCAPCERMEELRPGLRAAIDGKRGRFVRVAQGGSFGVGDRIVLE